MPKHSKARSNEIESPLSRHARQYVTTSVNSKPVNRPDESDAYKSGAR